MTNFPRLLRASDVASTLNVAESRVFELARQGILPCVRLGRQVRFCPATLERFIAGGGKALSGGWRQEA